MLVIIELPVLVPIKHYSHLMLLDLVHRVLFLCENLVQVRVSVVHLAKLLLFGIILFYAFTKITFLAVEL